MSSPRFFELDWYRRHGKYPARITQDSSGLEYVIGDTSWARKHPNKPEVIEGVMRDALSTAKTQLKP